MTRCRSYGEDTPFSEWMRSNPRMPSYSSECGFVATDNDFTLHRYMVSRDAMGTRDIQPIMQLEVKTRCGVPSKSQQDTLWKRHMFRGQRGSSPVIWNFGVYVLSMMDERPDTSAEMRWGAFTKSGSLRWTSIDLLQLEKLLLFEIDPENLKPQAFRRHHKTQENLVKTISPLGFEYLKPVVTKS